MGYKLNMILGVLLDTSSSTSETASQSTSGADMATGFLVALFFVAFFYIMYYVFNERKKRLQRPIVILLNPINRTMNIAGRFKQIRRNIRIPVTDSMEKIFWAIETENYVLMPAYGEIEDLIIEDDRRVKHIKIMMAEIIGVSSQGEEVIKEWAQYAFPEAIWEYPPELDMDTVPPNYVFVRPLYKREWGPEIFRKGLASSRHIFAEFTKMMSLADREQEVLHQNYGTMLAMAVESHNEIILTMEFNALQLWDTVSEQRVLPWEVLARLVHQPMDQLNFTGIAQAIHGGNMREVGSQVINSYRSSLDKMAEAFGLTTMSQSMAEMVLRKMNTMQDQLSNSMRREYERNQSGLNQLVDYVNNSKTPQNEGSPQAPQQVLVNQQPRPVVPMYATEDRG